ncbi:unnamed protein product [Soboliphyme baturini]|uniref:Uncharacterized protein n=1 Tax=Soboliphyme baturini TaxID=241478 RepID=A0A183IDJ6_9BILA|nr:unnamed protein product [Soboliphyme baturini]
MRKEEGQRPWQISVKFSHLPLMVLTPSSYTGSVVARVTKGRAGCRGTEADCEKSAIRTCSLPSGSRGRSSTTTADEDRRNDDVDINQQRSRYPF